MSSRRAEVVAITTAVVVGLSGATAFGQPSDVTPGFPEKIVQWGVQTGETCEDVAKAMYGSTKHTPLLLRYNQITCTPGAPLRAGMTLVLPATVTDVPTARITSVNPDTRARPAGLGWAPAFSGQPLDRNSNVNTREEGRASIQFVDRSRIYLAEHTLVVIFGTASQTAVSKHIPPVAQIKSGELQAGLEALRGSRTAEVAIAGGAQVSAASRDTVIRKKERRATVSVFDGAARVSSAGKAVHVPTNHGTSVVEHQPPTPPKQLPDPPKWDEGGSPAVILASDLGKLQARWKNVTGAVGYRLEVAKDEDFSDLILREETPANVRAFRAEGIPTGDYWLRVRAIDGEDYLGRASVSKAVSVLEATFSRGHGKVGASVIEVSPYSVLDFAPSDDLRVAVNDGDYEPLPRKLDFRHRQPAVLRFKRRGAHSPVEVAIRYVRPRVDIEGRRVGRSVVLTAVFRDLRGVDAETEIRPHARIHRGGVVHDVALAPASSSRFSTQVDDVQEATRVDVVDGHGSILASGIVRPPKDEPAARTPSPRRRHIGPTLSPRPFSPRVDVMAWAPTTRSAASLGSTVDSGNGGRQGMSVDAFAAGGFGALGIEVGARHRRAVDGTYSDTSGLVGGRFRLLDRSQLQIAAGARLAFPLDDSGPPVRLEPTMALGAAHGDWSWLANVGGRVRVERTATRGVARPRTALRLGRGSV